MKYLLVFITGATRAGEINAAMPGTMVEVERFDTLEDANKYGRNMDVKYGSQGEFIILPYYELEDA